MDVSPRSDIEQQRLEALRSYAILDTEAEPEFDDLTRIAAAMCATPIALVSLVDAERQWFKSRLGMEVTATDRDIAFCSHAIRGDTPMIVPDAAADDRFRDNPLVLGDLGIRFYAGAPLIDRQGHALGALCVMDRTPRQLTPVQIEVLHSLARQTLRLMELRRTAAQLAASLERVRQLAETIPICAHCQAVRGQNDEWQRLDRFISQTTDSRFTHGICPACLQQHYPV